MSHPPTIEKIVRLLEIMDEEGQEQALDFVQRIAKKYSPLFLLSMPVEQRSRYIAASFEAAADEDFEIFEAYSEEDNE